MKHEDAVRLLQEHADIEHETVEILENERRDNRDPHKWRMIQAARVAARQADELLQDLIE